MKVAVAKKPVPIGPYPGTDWTVLDERVFLSHRNRYLWCECRCGLRYYVQRGHLVGGRSLRCRACVNRAQVKDPTTSRKEPQSGDRVGCWRVLTGNQFRWRGYWCVYCECECGYVAPIFVGRLRAMAAKGCRKCAARKAWLRKARALDPNAPNLPSDTTDFDTMAELDAFIAERRKNLPSWWRKEIPEETPTGWTPPLIRMARRHNGRAM
jgi:hypothetical protein